MKVKAMVAATALRNRRMFFGGLVGLTAVATLMLLASARAADPGGSASAGKSGPVTLETIPGSAVKRVTLTAKAAERLGIETGKVGEQPVMRRQMVSGVVIPPVETQPDQKMASGGGTGGTAQGPAAPALKPTAGGVGGFGTFGGFGKVVTAQQPVAPATAPLAPLTKPAGALAKPGADGGVWLLVTLSQGEWDRLAKDKPARVLPLATRDKLANDVLARPSGAPPVEDVKRSMLTAYYVVPGKDHGLTLNTRMRVELPLTGSEDKQKVVPYSAVYYDGKGAPWVYVNTKPLVFERQRIAVDRIVGDLAVLSEGPAVGTAVVTVGAPLLYGTEIFGK